MDREDHKPCLESPLIQVSQEALPGSRHRKQLTLAGPLMSVNLLICSLQMISLSGASMATSFASVTGFSLLDLLLLAKWSCPFTFEMGG
ncbi:hypothetical protein AAG906_025546 [Vitis piasezkii]